MNDKIQVEEEKKLSFRDKLHEESISFVEGASLASKGTDIKKKLEFLAKGCYLVAGIETLVGVRKLEAMLVHARNTGRLTEEVEKCLQGIQQELLSNGKLSTSQSSSQKKLTTS